MKRSLAFPLERALATVLLEELAPGIKESYRYWVSIYLLVIINAFVGLSQFNGLGIEIGILIHVDLSVNRDLERSVKKV